MSRTRADHQSDTADSQYAFIGIDVSCAKKKRIPIVIAIKESGSLRPLPLLEMPLKPPYGVGNRGVLEPAQVQSYANQIAEYVQKACEYFGVTAKMIALDAPLEPRIEHINYRLAEKSLASKGISSFKTPSALEFEVIREKALQHLAIGGALPNIPHSMQLWMLAGFEIAKALRPLAPMIEVYPQATIRRLLPNAEHKSGVGIPALQLQALAVQTGWPTSADDLAKLPNICSGAMHDKVDAYGAAWVASLAENERESYGEGRDAIWVPKAEFLKPVSSILSLDVTAQRPKRRTKTDKLPQNNNAHQKLCPACKAFTFKRWPFGWDAHAAHRCSGLPKGDPEERKATFKSRYL